MIKNNKQTKKEKRKNGGGGGGEEVKKEEESKKKKKKKAKKKRRKTKGNRECFGAERRRCSNTGPCGRFCCCLLVCFGFYCCVFVCSFCFCFCLFFYQHIARARLRFICEDYQFFACFRSCLLVCSFANTLCAQVCVSFVKTVFACFCSWLFFCQHIVCANLRFIFEDFCTQLIKFPITVCAALHNDSDSNELLVLGCLFKLNCRINNVDHLKRFS